MQEGIIAVYILTNKKDGTLYIGSSVDLARRIDSHRAKAVKSFTKIYNLARLVYIELCETLEQALILERRYKRYLREWKVEMIEKHNPNWDDLSKNLYQDIEESLGSSPRDL
mgnify:CR=1 FL=1